MKFFQNLIFLYTVIVALSFTTALSAEKEAIGNSDASTYGELMLIEKKTETTKAWQLELSGMQEFSNPYLDINGVSLAAKKSIGPFVYVGPEYTRYFSSESEVNQRVSETLKTDTIAQTVFKPKDSVYGVVSLLPLSGHLNVLNRTAMPIELEANIGAGLVRYFKKSNEGAVLWRIGPRAFITESIGIQFQFGQEIESPFTDGSITKSHARFGIVGRF